MYARHNGRSLDCKAPPSTSPRTVISPCKVLLTYILQGVIPPLLFGPIAFWVPLAPSGDAVTFCYHTSGSMHALKVTLSLFALKVTLLTPLVAVTHLHTCPRADAVHPLLLAVPPLGLNLYPVLALSYHSGGPVWVYCPHTSPFREDSLLPSYDAG